MRSRPVRTMAAAGAAALALTACSDDGGGSGLPADAAPADVVAAGLGDRFENGAAFTLLVEGDLDALAEKVGEPAPPELEAIANKGLVTGAIHPEDGLALSIGEGDGFFEMLAVDEALYLRLDLQAVGETFPEAGDLPPPEVLRGQLESFPLTGDARAVAEAAVDGRWVGITGLSEEALQNFAESMGGTSQGDLEDQQEAMREVLEDQGLLDGETFTERYLVVDGEGPTYDVTVMARAMITTFNEIATELQDSLGAAAGGMATDDMPDPQDVPEAIGGFLVTVEDGTATAVGADVAVMMESLGEDTEEVEEGDLLVTMRLEDIGDQLDVPSDATTIGFEQLMTSVMGALMGGGLGG